MSRNDTPGVPPTEVVIHSRRPAVLEAVTDFAATIEEAWDRDETWIRDSSTRSRSARLIWDPPT